MATTVVSRTARERERWLLEGRPRGIQLPHHHIGAGWPSARDSVVDDRPREILLQDGHRCVTHVPTCTYPVMRDARPLRDARPDISGSTRKAQAG